MNKSENVKDISAALFQFHREMSKVSKEASNPFFKSKYASLPHIQEAIKEPLDKAGLVYAQFPTGQHGLTTIIMHPASGQWIEATSEMPPANNDPQGIGSAITYQRRYSLGAALGLTIDEDDDGNAASNKSAQLQEQDDINFN